MCIYSYVCNDFSPKGYPGGRRGGHVTCSRSHPVSVTWMPPLYFWHTKDQGSGQVDHFILLRYAYYSSNTIRVCVALFQQRSDRWRQSVCRSSDMNVSVKQQSPVSVLSCSSHSWALERVLNRDICLLKGPLVLS